jgi:deoxyribodipyrimidine photo-lyase
VRRGIVLFTCDLRVHDNAALSTAIAECREVVPAFVLDEALLAGGCGAPNRLSFLLDCLADLDGSLQARGARLVLRRGEVVAEAMRLAARHRAEAIYMSADTTPYARARERRLRRACCEQGIELVALPGPSIVEPGAVVPSGGGHYRVFTPYWRVWRAQPVPAPLSAPRRIPAPATLPAPRLPSLRSLTRKAPSPGLAAGGETLARKRLDAWVKGPLSDYEQGHDDLAGEATSHLSAHVHFGCLSPRQMLARVRDRPGAEAFVRQLCWRDFHRQVLADRPDLPRRDYRPRGDRWRRDGRGLEAWRAGLTGYPIVDAGMRQLAGEGFMHNRARLIVGSFLTKLLYVDWREGAAHFAGLLADADVANNVGNWQWLAGTGNDTRPNRVLNPLRQAHRFDPRGDYVRRHVPELAGIAGAAAHEPWRLAPAARRAIRYPPQILDHQLAATELRQRRGRAG